MARAESKRCTECRRWFRPAATAARSQRVCSAQCRCSRRRKLARRRRRRAPYRFRPEERLRQQDSRKRRSARAGHAPPSPRKSSDLNRELQDIVDSALELSRATLQRRLPTILARLEGPSGQKPVPQTPCHAPPSFRKGQKYWGFLLGFVDKVSRTTLGLRDPCALNRGRAAQSSRSPHACSGTRAGDACRARKYSIRRDARADRRARVALRRRLPARHGAANAA